MQSNTLSALARGATCNPLLRARASHASQRKTHTHAAAPCYDNALRYHSQRFLATLGSTPSVEPPTVAAAARGLPPGVLTRTSVVVAAASASSFGGSGGLPPAGCAARRRRAAIGPAPAAQPSSSKHASESSAAAAATVAGREGGSGAATAAASATDLARLFPGGEYSIEMQVRDYELDQFNVVNNAVYSSFFQHGRHEAFEALGHNVDDYARRGSPLALSQLNITFRAPLRSRDVFRVTVAVQRVTGARVVFHQRILKKRPPSLAVRQQQQQQQQAAEDDNDNDKKEEKEEEEDEEELIAEAEAVVVFLDSRYRPARLPAEVARLFQAVAALGKA